MIASLLMLVVSASAPPADIVVRGRRTLEALQSCVAHGCSTPDDARISIAYAEQLFAQGKYKEARDTLHAALARQSGHTRQFPRMVAALHEADATVNLHLGDMDRYRAAVIAQARTLRENLPEDDPQVLLLNVELGDFWLNRHRLPDARRMFEAAARGYAKRGQARMEALCQLRVVAVELSSRDLSAAADRLGAVSRSSVSNDPVVRQLNLIMAVRLALARGKQADVDTLLSTLRTDPSEPPMLIRSGKASRIGIDDVRDAFPFGDASPGLQPTSGGAVPIRWADIGFMIGPDGRVTDAEILRGSHSEAWAAPELAEIAGRQYAPINLGSGQPGLYRVERHTLRAERTVPRGSLVAQAVGKLDVEVLDMTSDAAATQGPDKSTKEKG